MLYLLIGIIPEIFLFYIYAINVKGLKEKKLLCFIGFSIIYLASKLIFRYSVYFNITCMFGFYGVLKLLYKDKAEITDIFLISFVSLLLVVSSVFTYFCCNNYVLSIIANRLLIIYFAYASKYFKNFYTKYMSCWNRNRQKPNKIKSLTLRNISVITFNLMIFIINLLLQTVI